MRFREFLSNETVAYVHSLGKNTDLYGPQKFAWWDVYVARPPRSPTPSVFPFREIQPYLQENGLLAKMTKSFNDASYGLAGLGFQRSGGVCVIRDFSTEVNQITGGGVGGHADSPHHAFAIDWSISPQTIVHEHAHMVWKYLPKPNRQFFENWFRTNVDNKRFAPNDAYQQLRPNIESYEVEDKLDELIAKRSAWVASDIVERIGISPASVNRVRSSPPGVENIHRLTLRPLYFAPMRLKNAETMERISGGYVKVPANSEVKVAIVADHARFLVDYNEKSAKYSIMVPADQIANKVYIDPTLLTKEQQDQIAEPFIEPQYEYDLYINPKFKDVVSKALVNGMEKIASSLNVFGKVSDNPYEKYYQAAQVFDQVDNPNAIYREYENAVISRAPFPSIDNFQKAILDVLHRLRKSGEEILENQPETVPQPRSKYGPLDKPDADPYRQMMAKQGIVPSPYAAANVGELWAELVEEAAFGGKSVSPELKKMLVRVLSGPVEVIGQNWRKPGGRIIKNPDAPRKGFHHPGSK